MINIVKKLCLLFGLSFCLSAYAIDCVNWQPGTFVPSKNVIGQKQPDYGLYWYNASTATSKHMTVMKACNYADKNCRQKELAGGFFDPHKPTIIFIHGWQPNTVKSKVRFEFCYQYQTGQNSKSAPINTLAAWHGYNVAVFYWNQFADDDLFAAEAKIYSTYGNHGMQWKYLDRFGNEHTCTAGDATCITPKKSIVELAFDAYKQAMPRFYHNEIRITGQSLGAQIAIQLTNKVLHDPKLAQPTRLALMDPYFGDDGLFTAQNNLPYSVATYNADTVEKFEHYYAIHHHLAKFPVSVYRTSRVSMAPTGNPNWALMSKVAYTRLYPVYLKNPNVGAKLAAEHLSSAYLYFNSKSFSPSISVDDPTSHINADSSVSQIVSMMGQKRYQKVDSIDQKSFEAVWLSKFTNKQPLDPSKR